MALVNFRHKFNVVQVIVQKPELQVALRPALRVLRRTVVIILKCNSSCVVDSHMILCSRMTNVGN